MLKKEKFIDKPVLPNALGLVCLEGVFLQMNHVNVKVNVKLEDVKEQDLKKIDAFNHLKHLEILHDSSDGWITL